MVIETREKAMSYLARQQRTISSKRSFYRGFSLVETLVAAAVVCIAVVSVVAIVRKGQEQMYVEKHRRTARAIADTTLEGSRFCPANFSAIPTAIADDFPLLESNVPARRLYSIVSGTMAGVDYKKITVKVRWTEPSVGTKDSVEISRLVPNIPSTINIAPLATNIFASSTFMGNATYPQCPPWNVVDGIIGLQFLSDWASTQYSPWIRIEWPQTYYITKIILYDRKYLTCRARNATISFSDLSPNISLTIPDEGFATVMFAPKCVTWIQIQLNGVGGFPAVGLAEVEVYE